MSLSECGVPGSVRGWGLLCSRSWICFQQTLLYHLVLLIKTKFIFIFGVGRELWRSPRTIPRQGDLGQGHIQVGLGWPHTGRAQNLPGQLRALPPLPQAGVELVEL